MIRIRLNNIISTVLVPRKMLSSSASSSMHTCVSHTQQPFIRVVALPSQRWLSSNISARLHDNGMTKEAEQRSSREDFFETRWNTYYDALQEFVKQHGHANVPTSHPKLASWVDRQRTQRRLRKSGLKSPMSDERMEKLSSVGFVWNVHDQSWDSQYQDLVAFHKEHGHSLVPKLHDSSLGRWVHNQRREYRKRSEGSQSSMTDDRLELLNKLDFVWDAWEASWMEQYKELCKYRYHHGNCLVPKTHELGKWVDNQRQQYKLLKKDGRKDTISVLTPERIELLEKIDFIWNAYDAAWMQRFGELEAFVEANGYGSTPKNFTNPTLASWIRRQRQLYQKRKNGETVTLTEERVAQLDTLGFIWKV